MITIARCFLFYFETCDLYRLKNDITIKFESIDRREIIPETRKIVVENENNLRNLVCSSYGPS